MLLHFQVPSRALLGFRTELISTTKGTAIIESELHAYEEHVGDIKRTTKGAIISTATGTTTAYSLRDVEEKGPLFVSPGMPVYPGQVIGEHMLEEDIEMNPTKTKKVTNVRSVHAEEQIKLSPPRRLSLEETLAYMRQDELVELTPKWVRLRKTILDSGERQRMRRDTKKRKQ